MQPLKSVCIFNREHLGNEKKLQNSKFSMKKITRYIRFLMKIISSRKSTYRMFRKGISQMKVLGVGKTAGQRICVSLPLFLNRNSSPDDKLGCQRGNMQRLMSLSAQNLVRSLKLMMTHVGGYITYWLFKRANYSPLYFSQMSQPMKIMEVKMSGIQK